MSAYNKFKKTVKKYGMLSGGETIIVGCSGGVDSMVLLHMLGRYTSLAEAKLVVAHLHHGLRGGEADRDEDFVRKAAEEMDMPFVSARADVKGAAEREKANIQDTARRARYDFFRSVMEESKGGKIALGHNADDQAETVIMRILRGAGIKGLGGIPPVSDAVVRPLIELTREDILLYASEEKVEFLEDSSNLELKYLRNRVRKELIPFLKGYNPRIETELTSLSVIAREAEDYMRGEALKAYREVKVNYSDRAFLCMDIVKLAGLHRALRARVISIALEDISGSPSGFFFQHINDVEKLIAKGISGACLDLPKKVKVSVEYGKLLFSIGSEKGLPLEGFNCELNVAGQTVIAAAGVTLMAGEGKGVRDRDSGKDCIFLDMDRIVSPLKVRSFRPGDRIMLKGMEGSKKIKDYFIDQKVPRHIRAKIPLLVSGDKVLWIVGMRCSREALADRESKKVLDIRKV